MKFPKDIKVCQGQMKQFFLIPNAVNVGDAVGAFVLLNFLKVKPAKEIIHCSLYADTYRPIWS